MSERCLSPPVRPGGGGTLWVLGWWCATQKSKIAYNLEYLARTMKCLNSISIN